MLTQAPLYFHMPAPILHRNIYDYNRMETLPAFIAIPDKNPKSYGIIAYIHGIFNTVRRLFRLSFVHLDRPDVPVIFFFTNFAKKPPVAVSIQVKEVILPWIVSRARTIRNPTRKKSPS